MLPADPKPRCGPETEASNWTRIDDACKLGVVWRMPSGPAGSTVTGPANPVLLWRVFL